MPPPPAKINAKLAFSLFVAFDLLNGNEVPSTGLGVGSLYVCRVTLSVAGFIEFNVTGNTVVLNAPKSSLTAFGSAEPAALIASRAVKYAFVAHGGYSGNGIVAAVVGEVGRRGVDEFLNAGVEFSVAAFLIEGGNIDSYVFALSSVEDNVSIPGICRP